MGNQMKLKVLGIIVIVFIGLFLVDYHQTLDIILLFIGLLLIQLSIICITQIKNFILFSCTII